MTRVPALPALLLGLTTAAGVAQADNVYGTWSNVFDWPLIPIHTVLLPDQRVLSYGSSANGLQGGSFIYDVWDPTGGLAGGHQTLPNLTITDIFCSSQVLLPDGSGVFIAGGDRLNAARTQVLNSANQNSNLFRLSDNTLNAQSNLQKPRWYSTSTVLTNGEIYIQGGTSGTEWPEVRQSTGVFRALSAANTQTYDFMYPRNWVAPNGLIFGYDSGGKMYTVNPAGTGTISSKGTHTGPKGNDASAVMFRPGRILQFGGNSNLASIIDVNGANPIVTATGQLRAKRVLVNATVLPDGKVLATGGSGEWNSTNGVTKYAEIWDPSTGVWTSPPPGGPSGVKARLYHSVALLLPDASVLVGGGGANSPTTSLPENNTNIEVYYPPYLYGPGGGFASRLNISGVQGLASNSPTTPVVKIGETFPVDWSGTGTVSRVTLVKTGSVTHSWNMDQRFVEATFQTSGNRVMVQAPTRAADAPPGFYMLFLLNASGTPSVSRMVEIPVAATPNPAVTPVLTSPGNQSGPQGTAVNLQVVATDPNLDELGYAATGLPAGLSIHPLTGLISGTPTTPGSYNVVVATSDGVNTASANLVWQISQIAPLVLAPLPQPAPLVNGSTVSFAGVVSNGVVPQYRWYFDDGTPETAWSSSPDIQHVFAQPGVYYVTLTVTDARGVQQFSTVPVTVHFPLTALAPAASGNLAYGAPGGATDRLWVVNQDNNSVSVFSAASNVRLAQIPVQLAPRAIAIAPDGSVWVTNKQSASISIIDPATLTVSGTISLPRGSQPYGLVFAPGGSAGYVVLEGLGKVLKIGVGSRLVIGETDVGPHPRHASVSGDGTTLYVSRFITPTLPGEDTADVQPGTAGGEVVEVATGSMQVVRTISLRHLSTPDTAIAGSGVPNYLGPAVISPDGTQAFVPSKQDNIRRGTLRSPGLNLNFQNTVRAITSRLDLTTDTEDLGRRIDHDNASVSSAVAFDRLGVYAFAALETSREVAVVSAHTGLQVLRVDVGRAPQGLVVSPDGTRLYVSNFMDRTVDVFNLSPLVDGIASVPHLATLQSVTGELLPPNILLGKQLFYDARDPRLALDRYMSCATCHNDGGADGRVWDLTGMGEGLRNTISLRGRAAGQGFLHWSNNFDELQDFEGQIRALSGGTGLMSDEDFDFGTRDEPLGLPKAGLSPDLDALAAYVASLATFEPSPARNGDGSLTAEAAAGRDVFARLNCAACHGGGAFTTSGPGTFVDVGTIRQPTSGQRLGQGLLTGIDVPTLRDVWATAPYLHDGSAPSLSAAIEAHAGITVPAGDLPLLTAYVEQIGGDEGPAPIADDDGDGVVDALDNCTLLANPAQCDSDADGYGNRCDADLNNNGAANAQDSALFRAQLGLPSAGPTYNPADLNCSGSVNAQDSGLFRSLLGQPLGPSGLAP